MDTSVPQWDSNNDFLVQTQAPQNIAKLIKDACYDCHSYETEYPWYSKIQPVGWWLRSHVRGGRINLNYSEWGTLDEDKKKHKIEETIEEIEAKHMPLKSFTWTHPEARLSETDIKSLIDWAKNY